MFLFFSCVITPVLPQPSLPITNYPILNNTFEIEVTHIERPNKVFVQCGRYRQTLAELLDDLYNYYETNGKLIIKKNYNIS